MSTDHKKEDTELLIKNTAMQLFFAQGHFKATTQEIADAAGVNRTSINYYFRSRDNLFNIVFDEAIQQRENNHNAILFSELPFRTKLEMWIEDELASAIKYPFLEIYIVTELQSKCSKFQKSDDHFEKVRNNLTKEVEEQVKLGNIKPIEPMQFLLNVASLVKFPTCMRNLIIQDFKLSDDDFKEILQKRKQVIVDTIFI